MKRNSESLDKGDQDNSTKFSLHFDYSSKISFIINVKTPHREILFTEMTNVPHFDKYCWKKRDAMEGYAFYSDSSKQDNKIDEICIRGLTLPPRALLEC